MSNTTTNHTPGPWTVQQLNHYSRSGDEWEVDGDLWLQIGHFEGEGDERREIGPIAEIIGHESQIGYMVARLKYLVTPESEQRANAALIAAAPELFDALCAMLLEYDAGGVTLAAAKQARAAVVKAGG